MSDEKIKVTYANIEQVLADIKALQSMASDCTFIDISMGQSKGMGWSAIQDIADSLSTVAVSLQSFLGRSYTLIEQSKDEFRSADSGLAGSMESIG